MLTMQVSITTTLLHTLLMSLALRGTTCVQTVSRLVSAAGTGSKWFFGGDRGEWVSGTIAGHYDRFSITALCGFCNVGIGNTTDEAPTESSRMWIKQVAQSDVYSLEVVVKSGSIRNGKGIVLEATLCQGYR